MLFMLYFMVWPTAVLTLLTLAYIRQSWTNTHGRLTHPADTARYDSFGIIFSVNLIDFSLSTARCSAVRVSELLQRKPFITENIKMKHPQLFAFRKPGNGNIITPTPPRHGIHSHLISFCWTSCSRTPWFCWFNLSPVSSLLKCCC